MFNQVIANAAELANRIVAQPVPPDAQVVAQHSLGQIGFW